MFKHGRRLMLKVAVPITAYQLIGKRPTMQEMVKEKKEAERMSD